MKTRFPRLFVWAGGIAIFFGLCCAGFFILAEIAGRDPAVQATGTARALGKLTGTALAHLPTATPRPPTATDEPTLPTPTLAPSATKPASIPTLAEATAMPMPSLLVPTFTPSFTASPTSTPVQEWEEVTLGMCADQVLALHPESEALKPPEQAGQDSEGLLLKWFYAGAELLFGRRLGADDGITCYRVLEIILVP